MSDFKIVSLLNPGNNYNNVSGILAASLSGNTDGVLAAISTGTLVLAGGNNITLSQDGQSVSIIGGAGGGGGGGVAIAAGTQTATTNTIVFSNSNGITFGMSGSTRITASYTVPSTAGLLSAINVSGGTTSNNLSALTFSNSNGVSFGLNGSTLTATVKTDYQTSGAYLTTAMQSNAATISNVNVSAGTTSNNLSAFTFADSNGVSFGLNASTITLTVKTDYQSSGAYLTTAMQSNAATISNINLSAGTTSGNASAFTFANGNGVSFGLNAGTITGSVAAAGGAQTAISGVVVSDTTYTSGTISFSNQNGVTIGSSANGATQYVRLSVATNYQLQGAYLTTAALSGDTTKYVENWKLTGNTAGTTSSAQGNDLWLAGGNGVTISGSSNTLSFSVATNYQSQAAYLTTAALSGDTTKYVQNWKLTGNTAGTTSSAQGTDLWFSGGNNITLSGNSNTIIVSAANAGGAQTAISGVVVSDTTYTSGTVSFSNQNGVTIGSSVNGATQYIRLSVATNYLTTAALSGDTTKYVQNWKLTGNTAGTTSSAQGTDLWFSGGNSITVSGSSNSIVFSVGAYLTTADLSANSSKYVQNWKLTGNTAGTSSSAQGTDLWFSGQNLTFSGNSNTIVVSAPPVSQLTGVNPVSLSSNGSTVSVLLNPIFQYDLFGANIALVTNSTLGQSSLFFYPFDLHYPMSASRINFFLSVITQESAAASSGSGSLGIGYALYTRGTGASSERISQLTSYSAVIISYTASSDSRFAATHYNGLSNATSHTTTSSAISSSNASTYMLNSLGGYRVVALPVNSTLTPGRYWLGFSQQSTNNAAASWSIAANYMQLTQTNWIAFRPFGTSSAASNASVYGAMDGAGTYSAQSAAWPNSIGLSNSDIKMAVSLTMPYFNLSGIGTTSNFL